MKVKLYFLLDEHYVVRYVGKTQKPLCDRLAAHVYEAKNLKKRNHRVNWIKSMLDKGLRPTIELKYELDSHEEASVEEKYWIKTLKSMGFKLTNGTKGGEGCPCTEETKKKISIAAKRRYAENPELREFARRLAKRTIAKYRRKPGEYSHSEKTRKLIGKRNTERSKESWEKMAKSKSRPVKSIDIETGQVKEYGSTIEASMDMVGKRTSSLMSVLRGKKPSAYGKRWEYVKKTKQDPPQKEKKEIISVEMIGSDFNKIFTTIKDAADFLEVEEKKAYMNIYRVVKGRGKTAYGYGWRETK